MNYGAYGRLIQHCTDHLFFRVGKQLHARLVLSSVAPDNFLGSKLISFYSKSGSLRDAYNVFGKIPRKNIFSWNALFISYTLHNMHTDLLKLFLSLVNLNSTDVKPDRFTVTCVLKALASLFSNSVLAKEVHCFILRRELESDIFVVNALITFYSRCDELVLARIMFDRMPERDIVSWNAMLAGYSQGGSYEKCKELFRVMSSSLEVKPNALTAVSVLQACAQSNDLIFGMEVHRFVNESQIKMDVSLWNAVIGLYAKCGSLDYARELFEEMPEKDGITYCSMISGYMVHGFVNQAMDLFRELERPRLPTWNAVISGLVQNNRQDGALDIFRAMQSHGCRPNTVTLASILPIFSHFSTLKGGKEIHGYAIRNTYDGNIFVATAIIDSYAKCGYLQGARQVFDQLKGRSLIAWTSIISAYAVHGDANVALSLFYEMLTYGIQPDQVTFTSVLAACAHSGELDEAWKIFNILLPEYGIQPLVEHYACMVGVLSRAGKLSDAVEFISKMPLEPNAKVWGALLNGASVAGDVELGKYVFDRLFEIEPGNTGNYVIMANLYSQSGRWKEADTIRDLMKEVRLKKIPGNSWIETRGGLQSFC
ncbi:pentatricopeptide repeat-containing protein At2g37310 [Cucumis melo]|uniref:Pentatricopeptide repeat-containing protein At2g37310 n=1 Tax=Cucumis melo TaxID=3656 RepID=A0A1S4DUS9_CUCME|nr:pentatricopeptide repeat-containing protein At2g37310 [Cucumis melo]XP_050940159.1 pentatricopeptide repeat-containing protein At2g37310 [Cucumis melo]